MLLYFAYVKHIWINLIGIKNTVFQNCCPYCAHILIYLRVYIHMHVYNTISDKRGHTFKSGQGGSYGRVWGEELEEEMV